MPDLYNLWLHNKAMEFYTSKYGSNNNFNNIHVCKEREYFGCPTDRNPNSVNIIFLFLYHDLIIL